MKRKLYDLMNQRTTHLDAATAALEAGDTAAYDTALAAATGMNPEIDQLTALVAAQERYTPASLPPAPGGAENLERAEALHGGAAVSYSVGEIVAGAGLRLRSVQNSTTLASGDLVKPEGAGSNIRGGNDALCSIIDQVSVVDLSGMGAYSEPYVLSELEATSGAVATLAGTARAASDPVFRIARIKPFEVNVTSYVDRNLANLTPAAYETKIRGMAMRALRRAVGNLILNGDGQATPDMFGIKTAKNSVDSPIYAIHSVPAGVISADTLMKLYFSYGGDEEVGGNARLYLTKQDLAAVGAIRGTNEKRRLFDIRPDVGNANSGVITDGGYLIPYTISGALTSLSTSVAGATAVQTMLYGDPANYELGLFGNYSIRVDESCKAVERMHTILGDCMVGGNLIVHKGFVVATVDKKTV
ncbi:MAG: phage major capsid protein [Oscillospiraceae bacterium]